MDGSDDEGNTKKVESQGDVATAENSQKAVNPEDSESDDNKIDDEETGGQWVTQDNLYSHIGGADAFNLMANDDNSLFKPKGEEENKDGEE